MGYYGLAGPEARSRLKWKIEPQKCFFCDEERIQTLDSHCRKRKEAKGAEDLVLLPERQRRVKMNEVHRLCPSHHREIHLGWKELPVNN